MEYFCTKINFLEQLISSIIILMHPFNKLKLFNLIIYAIDNNNNTKIFVS